LNVEHPSSSTAPLRSTQINDFFENGYLLIKHWADGRALESIQRVAKTQHTTSVPPLELEAQLGYPGAPANTNVEGGSTPRRLLRAFGRNELWDEHATSNRMNQCLQQLLKHQKIYMSQAHHNCLMTKSPRFSSDTGWHRDSRYWQFEKNELVTAWLALSDENESNGALKVIPGSHKQNLGPDQFDSRSFFSEKDDRNTELLKKTKQLNLSPGDLLFFHCDLLHAASRNNTESDKLSLVFTYFNGANSALPNSRSASIEPIPLDTP